MKNQIDYQAANLQLASLMGWTDLKPAFSPSTRRPAPPYGLPPSKALRSDYAWLQNQLQTPDWCNSWSASGALIADYGVSLWSFRESVLGCVDTGAGPDEGIGASVLLKDHASREAALRYCVVLAVIEKLKVDKNNPSRNGGPL